MSYYKVEELKETFSKSESKIYIQTKYGYYHSFKEAKKAFNGFKGKLKLSEKVIGLKIEERMNTKCSYEATVRYNDNTDDVTVYSLKILNTIPKKIEQMEYGKIEEKHNSIEI